MQFRPSYSRRMQTKLAPLRHNDPVTAAWKRPIDDPGA